MCKVIYLYICHEMLLFRYLSYYILLLCSCLLFLHNRGLAAVHRIGRDVIHRDVKSYNFLVDSQLNAKIADLELGIIGEGDGNETGMTIDGDIESTGGGAARTSSVLDGAGRGSHNSLSNLSRHSHLSHHSHSSQQSSNHSVRQLAALGVGTKVRNANEFLANWLPPELILEPLCTYQASDTYRYVVLMYST
jgi:serine/threonine protein kinase